MKFALHVLFCVLLLPAAARADTIFTIENGTTARTIHLPGGATQQNSGTFNGTVTIDTVTGLVTDVDVAFVGNIGSFTFTGPPIEQGNLASPNSWETYVTDADGDNMLLLINASSLVNYGGGSLCSGSDPCDGVFVGAFSGPNDYDQVATGSLAEQTAVTPEPSSVALLGTGLLGILATLRKRVTGQTSLT